METIIERDGLFTLSTSVNYRCVTKAHAGKWVGGTYDPRFGQFSDGRNFARGMSANSLLGTYTREFKTKKEALAWITDGDASPGLAPAA